jgi:hypothetical protein
VNLAYPVDTLVSYHYYGGDDIMEAITGAGRLRLIGDSGAFSAHTQGAVITLGAYAGWVSRWQDRLAWAASLDVIGDPEATWANWLQLRDGLGVTTVPTLHAGTDPAWLDRYADEGVDFAGLGGLVGRPVPRVMPWLVHVFRYCRDRYPAMRFHAWGVSGRRILDALPFWSADSSYALSAGWRYGKFFLFDPRTARTTGFALDGRDPYRHNDLISRIYGADPASLTPSNRTACVKLAAASAQQYAAWLQARHKVTPPASATLTGTRFHVAPCKSEVASLLTGPRVHVTTAENALMKRIAE